MKHLKLAIIAIAAVTLFACKKQNESVETQQHEKSAYRVIAVGKSANDTGTVMFARTETVGLITAEDSRLRATLIAYTKLPDGRGQYVIEMTNLQACAVILHWGWQGLVIDQTTPNDNTLLGNETKTYTLIGEAKPGQIKVSAEKTSNDCNNSSTLIVNITDQILPVKLLSNVATYDEVTKKVTISFTLEDPAITDYVIVQRQNKEHQWVLVTLVFTDHLTKNLSIKL